MGSEQHLQDVGGVSVTAQTDHQPSVAAHLVIKAKMSGGGRRWGGGGGWGGTCFTSPRTLVPLQLKLKSMGPTRVHRRTYFTPPKISVSSQQSCSSPADGICPRSSCPTYLKSGVSLGHAATYKIILSSATAIHFVRQAKRSHQHEAQGVWLVTALNLPHSAASRNETQGGR